MMQSMASGVAVAVTAGVAGAASSTIVIDDFSTGFSTSSGALGIVPVVGLLDTTSTEINPSGALGNRTTTISLDPDTTSSTLGIFPTDNRLSFSNGSLQTQNSFEIEYDDLSQNNFSSLVGGPRIFAFDVVSSDLDDRATPVFLDVEIIVNDVSQTVSVSGEGQYSIAFSEFSGVDFTNVETIKFGFGTENIGAVDIGFGNFNASIIPLPHPAAMAAAGLAGIAVVRRRR